jgi:hypothetical protein
MVISSHVLPRFIEEFRILKLESLKKDLHKLTPDELGLIKEEIENLLNLSCARGNHE